MLNFLVAAILFNQSWSGKASYYWTGGCLGCYPHYREDGSVYYLMNNGEVLDDTRLTVAFNKLPLNSYVLVRNANSDKAVIAKVTDTGGFEDLENPKIIDLSLATKNALGCGDVCDVVITSLQRY